MTTTLIVDGYNAINAIPEIYKEIKNGLLAARRSILSIAKEYARSSGCIKDVKVIFDGDSRYRHAARFDIIYDKSQIFSESEKGDDTIIETVRNFSRHGRVILASNDNYVRNNSRAYGASLIFVEELIRKNRNQPRIGSKKTDKLSDTNLDKNIGKDLQEKITREYREILGI